MATVAPQIKKVAERCGAQHVTFAGGRGMITHAQKEALAAHGMRYITALATLHIAHLLQTQQLQMQLFDDTRHEVYGAEWRSTICNLHKKLYLRVLMTVK